MTRKRSHTIGSISTDTLNLSELFSAFLWEAQHIKLNRTDRNAVRRIAAARVTDGESVEERLENEDYFVPSLLARAMTETPTSIAFKQTVAAMWQEKPEYRFFQPTDKWFLQQVKGAIKKYLNRQLGQAA